MASRRENLKRMLQPKSVAVIGASAKTDKAGFQALKALEGFEGAVWPVNPQGGTILGLNCLRSIDEIPGAVDLAILAVPSEGAVGAFEQLSKQGCGGALIVSGGFGEAGEAGLILQQRLETVCSSTDTRLLGPNTSGFVNPALGCRASFVPGLEHIRPGSIAVIAQSGGVNLTLAFMLNNAGHGLSLALGLGNAIDVDTSDVLEFALADQHTKAIVIHLEGIGNGRRLYETLRKITPFKPVVGLVVGRSEVGEFAQSHTGRMLGSFDRKVAMLRQAGVIVAYSTEEAADAVATLSMVRLAPSKNPGVAVVTGQAGPGLLIADSLNEGGSRLAQFGPATRQKLSTLLPPLTFLGNPVDTGRPGPSFAAVLDCVAGDPEVAVTAVFALHEPSALDPMVVLTAAQSHPIVFGTLGVKADVAPVLDTMAAAGVPAFTSPERLARALSVLAQDARYRARNEQAVCKKTESSSVTLPHSIDEAAAKVVVGRYGIATPKSWIVSTLQEATQCLQNTKAALVLKILDAEIAHKTEIGGVVVNVKTAQDMEAAYAKVSQSSASATKKYLVEEMAAPGIDLIVGGVRDENFGPMVLLGIGGTLAEIIKDSASRLAPLGESDVDEMIEELRAKDLLNGFRDIPAVDKDKLRKVLVSVSSLVVENDAIGEIEINPLRGCPDGSLVALDALITRVQHI